MRLRLIQIPAVPSLGVYPTYRIAAAVQELVRRQFLDAKSSAAVPQGAGAPSSGVVAVTAPPPTVIAFTPSPTFTLGRRQSRAALGAAALARLQAPLSVAVARRPDDDDDFSDPDDRDVDVDDPNDPADRDSYIFTPSVYSAPRGGLTTYHGPGQAVLWPVLDLKSPQHRHLTVRCYSRLLEDTTAAVLQRVFGVATRTTADPGLWVPETDCKIAALGVHLRRNIAALGVAVNLDTPVTEGDDVIATATATSEAVNPWRRFVPCGLDKGVTCVAAEGRRRFGHVPADWDLRPAPFSAQWAAELAERLGLESGLDVADDVAVRALLERAREHVEQEEEQSVQPE